MPSQVKYPTASSVVSTEDFAWSGLSSAYASDNVSATTSMVASFGTRYADIVFFKTFGFTIPSGATIDGIKVGFERYATWTYFLDYAYDNVVYLVKNGTVEGNTPSGEVWTGSEATQVYGSATDKWGGTWTASDINNANFGVQLGAAADFYGVNEETPINGETTLFLDSVYIEVFYTEAAGGSSTNRMMMMFE